MAIFRNSCSLFEDVSTLVALFRDNFCYLTLTDNGITFTTDTSIHEELVDVTKPSWLTVNEVFTITCTEIATCYNNLICIVIKSVHGV